MSLSSKYLKGELLGEGTWGSVFSAERRSDSVKVAIKRIKPMYVHLGVNFTALREIKYLRYIKGENVVDVSYSSHLTSYIFLYRSTYLYLHSSWMFSSVMAYCTSCSNSAHTIWKSSYGIKPFYFNRTMLSRICKCYCGELIVVTETTSSIEVRYVTCVRKSCLYKV